MTGKRSVLANIGLIFATAVLGGVAVEIGLRSFAPFHTVGYYGLFVYDPELAIDLKPGIHHFETKDFQEEVITNPLATTNFQQDFEGYQRTIFTVGDSFTQGSGLPADAAYPFQLDILLNGRTGTYVKDYAVVNLGVGGYGGKQSLIRLERYIRSMGPPDHILYLGTGNDQFGDELLDSGYRFRSLVEGNPFWGRFSAQLVWLGNEVQIVKRLKFLVRNIRVKFNSREDERQSERERGVAKPIALLQAPNFEKLKNIADRIGAKLAVSWVGAPDSYEWLKDWAFRNDVEFADWLPHVESVQREIPRLPLQNQHSGGHYRTWAIRLIAESFGRSIRAQELGANRP